MSARRKQYVRHIARWAATIAFVLAPAPRVVADELFRGKTVTIYVGTPIAGGYDLYGRLLSRHIGRHLPGNPTVIVSNMPGGSGINCANFMYAVAPKDGTALGILIQTMGEEQALGTEGVRFDVARFNWVGRITSNVEMAYVWHTSPTKTIADAKTRETILASAGPASIIYPLLLNQMIGTRFKLVRGYQGTQNTHLAMQRGEVEGTTSSVNTVKTTTDWLTGGEINVLVQYAPQRHAAIPNVPAVAELPATADDRALLSFLTRASAIGRSFVAPPGIAPEPLAALRTAFDATMRDPEFIADIRQLRAEFDPLPGAELQRLFEQGELSDANRERVKAARAAH
jgi:tripartite-type tricarboxylate transporter receptor subunit TctC